MAKAEATRTILVPVDFSDHSRAALLWACQQARDLDCQVVVLHVVHDPAEAPGYYRKNKADAQRPMEEVAEKMMQRFLKAAGKRLADKKHFKKSVSSELVVGVPVPRILEVAKKIGATHIVMGSQGRTGLKRLLLGSKAEQVVRMAKIPVTIVKR